MTIVTITPEDVAREGRPQAELEGAVHAYYAESGLITYYEYTDTEGNPGAFRPHPKRIDQITYAEWRALAG